MSSIPRGVPASQAEYLKKYLSGGGGGTDEKKVKKKKVKGKATQGLRIVDADEEATRAATRRKPQVDEDEEEKPVVVEVVEAPRRAEHAIIKIEGEDTGGWTNVDDVKDESPPRRRRVDADSSPPRRNGTDSSPPRKRRVDADSSPPRRRMDTDSSPQRRRAGADSSPPRRRAGADSSPPRRRMDTDSSPPRRRVDADSSPPRRRMDTDSSPPRKRRVDADSSPPRRRVDTDSSPPRRRADEAEPSSRKKPVMSNGGQSGLQYGHEFTKQVEARRKQDQEKFAKADPKLMGKGEDTVFRDKRGRRLQGLEQFLRQQDGKHTEAEEDGMEWGKGKVQLQEKVDEQKRMEEEANKPFARYKDDEDLDAHYRDIDRWGDPMAGLVRKKPKGDKAKPMYKGPAPPPNRFNIPPGYRWDGVDRSNGFEKELFKSQSKKTALKEEAYLWSVEDM